MWLGDGNRRPNSPFSYVAQDVTRLGLEGRVHFVGARIDPEPYFLACDALALTSRLDPFPCIVHEAMACAKPVIAFANAGGAPEALQDGAGFVVPYGDIAQMAAVLRRLAADPLLAAEVGVRAQRRLSRVYDFFAYAEKVVALAGPRRHVPLAETEAERLPCAAPGGLRPWRGETGPSKPSSIASLRGSNVAGSTSSIVVTDVGPARPDVTTLPKAPLPVCRPESPDDQTGLLAICERLEYALRAAGPVVYVHDLDPAGAAVVPALGGSVAVVGVMPDDQTGSRRAGRSARPLALAAGGRYDTGGRGYLRPNSP